MSTRTMDRTRRAIALTLGLSLLAVATPARAGVPGSFATERPDGQGDQLIFYYDARDGFTTFVNVRNAPQSASELDVRVEFYGGDFSVPFTVDVSLAPAQLRILDVGALRAEGLPAQTGVAIATAVDASGNSVVTRSLTGSFTVANLATGSGWGAAALARSAVVPDDEPGGAPSLPPLGSIIDGGAVALTPIQPRELDLACYYDPADLAPAAEGGNQLIFVSFADRAGGIYQALPAATPWRVLARRSDGSLIGDESFSASGVVVTDLVSLLGQEANGSSGSIRFSATPTIAPVTRFVFFVEALGTIGTGYLLPSPGIPTDAMPAGVPAR